MRTKTEDIRGTGPARGRLAGWALALLLAGCGGGSGTPGEAAEALQGSAGTPGTAPLALAKAADAPGAPAAQVAGRFGPVFDMTVLPIHMVLQPDGQVLYFGADSQGATTSELYGLWDPRSDGADGVRILAKGRDNTLFCSSQTLLPDGSTFVAGGGQARSANAASPVSMLFAPGGGQATRGQDMHRARWYASSTLLLDGEVLVQGGNGGADFPEVRQRDGSWRLLTGAPTGALSQVYPRNWIAPDGRVVGYSGDGTLYHLDPAGTGTLTPLGRLPATQVRGVEPAAMFRPGRILQLAWSSPAAVVIDVRGALPTVAPTAAGSSARFDGTATVLADGRVFASGGGAGRRNDLAGAALGTQTWDPVSGTWTQGPALQLARLYHSTALLLPDARVLVAGGGAPGPLLNTNGEIYSPPYLFDAAGVPARRPRLQGVPAAVLPGQAIEVQVATPDGGPVSRMTLVRSGSASHAWTTDQRFVDLPWHAGADGKVRVQLPSQAGEIPPGFYLLFAFDAQGVPSEAAILAMGIAQPRPAGVPMLPPLPDRLDEAGQPVVVEAPAAGPWAWSASGLPAGVAVDPGSGRLAGTPRIAGSWFVTLAADDGTWSTTRSFLWTIGRDRIALQAPPPVPAAQALAGVPLAFTATANPEAAGTLSFQWDFGDGSTRSPPTREATTSHVFARPGLYAVTVMAPAPDGRQQSRTLLQMVGLPVLPGRPARSSALLVEERAGAGRVWVANRDSGTVTVFDAASHAKLAEVPVGREPVALALTGGDRVWVSIRGDDTLTAIDTGTLRALRTVALPAGSQPHGLLALPGQPGRLLVVLEGSGELLLAAGGEFRVLGRQPVGPHVRHVAADASGSRIYLSRFITPPLPGEATAVVQAQQDGRTGGGEVLVLDRALRPQGTIVLALGERPDGETQGRGIPNYLGAASLSPDGSQAWVPSKQDNVQRGLLRAGRPLDFQGTVRAVTSRIVLPAGAEDLGGRIDHDDAGVASAAAFDPSGAWLFVALETSREVAVVSAHDRRELLRLQAGLLPRAVEVAPDGSRLYVSNELDRSLSVFDLAPLLRQGVLAAPLLATLRTVVAEPLPAQLLRGKQLFHDARDPRLARDRYLSCAACHHDGGHDGRTWDLSHLGEGLRNTPSLRARPGALRGALHGSGSFDEVQDFEMQIRQLAGGSGLLPDADLAVGTRRLGRGDAKAGLAADLDALAAYVESLREPPPSPWRAAGGLGAAALAGRALFASHCVQCHGGPAGTDAATGRLHRTGTVTAASGRSAGQTIAGLAAPGLAGAWATAPYLHRGQAATLEAAIQAHQGGLDATALAQLAAYLREDGPARDPVPFALLPAQVRSAGGAAAAGSSVLLAADAASPPGASWMAASWPSSRAWTTRLEFRLERAGGAGMPAFALLLHGSGPAAIAPGGACGGHCSLAGWVGAVLAGGADAHAGLAHAARPASALPPELARAAVVTGRLQLHHDPVARQLQLEGELVADGVRHALADTLQVDLQQRFPTGFTLGVVASGGRAVVRGWTAQ